MSDGRGRTRSIVVGLVAALALVLAAGIAFVLSDRGAGSPSQSEIRGEADGITLRSLILTDEVDPASGSPGPPRDGFHVGEPVTAWVSFDYEPEEGGTDVLRLVWWRGGEELFQSTLRMPQPIDHAAMTLGAAHTSEPGTYVVRAYANDTELTAVEFTVR